MNKIKFTTKFGTAEISDSGISTIDGESRMLWLNDIDANSGNMRLNTIQPLEMPGQRVLSAVPSECTIVLSIAFAPIYISANEKICTGQSGMDLLRREVMMRFPLGISGTLEYTNANGTYTITARADETPVITVRDGWLCEAKVYLTADYPYWCKPCTLPKGTAEPGNDAVMVARESGDIASPVMIEITCIETVSGSGTLFTFKEENGNFKKIDFVRGLEAGEKLKVNLMYNNDFSVMYHTNSMSGYGRANGFIYLTEYCVFPENMPGGSVFSLSTVSGKLEAEVTCFNLFLAI